MTTPIIKAMCDELNSVPPTQKFSLYWIWTILSFVIFCYNFGGIIFHIKNLQLMEHYALNTLPILRSIRTKIYSGLLSSVLSTAAKIANKDMYLR